MIHAFSTHIPALYLALSRTDGNVLELGTGFFSTFLLHDMLTVTSRLLVSVEDNEAWFSKLQTMKTEKHLFVHSRNPETTIKRIGDDFDVVLIDCGFYKDRLAYLKHYLQKSKIVILHDYGDENSDSQWASYGLDFEEVSKTVEETKYRVSFHAQAPYTIMLSNFINIEQITKDSIS